MITQNSAANHEHAEGRDRKHTGTPVKVKVTEHPELRWWWYAVTVKAHNAGRQRR